MKQLITTLFILMFLQPSWASLYRNYQVEDGLSHNSVWAVMQDKQGFLWFGTVDGLNRFDGNSFKIYKKQHEKVLKIVDELFEKIGYERQPEVIELFDLITQTAKEML